MLAAPACTDGSGSSGGGMGGGMTLPALKAALSAVLEAQQFPVGGCAASCQSLPVLNALLRDALLLTWAALPSHPAHSLCS
jgi:hypothetical protein